MTRYLTRRAAQSIIVILTAMVGMFLIGRVLGDPVATITGEFATEEVRQRVSEELGYNDPVIVQFGRFVVRVLTLDFGVSPVRGQDAMGLVLEALPNTIVLSLGIMAISIPLGLLIGSTGAVWPGSLADRVGGVLSLTGISVVEFWLGLTLILFIAVPIAGIPTGGTQGAAALLLPAVTGAFRFTGRIAQFSRSALLEEYNKPYIETLRAKGLSEWRVFGHVAKNASVPIVTLSGDELIGLANGIVVIETVFAWPGIGALIIRSVFNRDLFVLEAAIFVLVLIVVIGNFIIDMTYTALNPKIRYQSHGV